jgi:hypothetical protein
MLEAIELVNLSLDQSLEGAGHRRGSNPMIREFNLDRLIEFELRFAATYFAHCEIFFSCEIED